jgi:hypothetical protein
MREGTSSKPPKLPVFTDQGRVIEIFVLCILHQIQSFRCVELLRETRIRTSLLSNEQLAMIVRMLKERIQFVQHRRSAGVALQSDHDSIYFEGMCDCSTFSLI